MATMSPSTFNPLLSYVNVRLRQGVPIVDADLNELDDVRKFELRAFLKWFVGDGVPEGNDGFHVAGGLDNDFTIQAGPQVGAAGAEPTDAALHHVGRLLVDGVDVIIMADRRYSEQSLHESQPGAAALAAARGVPVAPRLTTPATATTQVVYLDVWERLVTPDDVPELLHPGLGVETCARMLRDWVVRVGPRVPQAGDADLRPGHLYYPLATLIRAANAATIPDAALTDLREARLLLPPAHLLTDTLGVDPREYRRGAGRPVVNLRDAINAVLAGRLPATDAVAVSPGPGSDAFRRAATLDASGGLLAVWHSPRSGNTNQVLAARLDLDTAAAGFAPAVAVTSGNTAHQWPHAVVLPGGDVVVAYQTGEFDTAGTAVQMRRAPLAGLPAATEVPLASAAGVAVQAPLAVLCGDHVVFFVHQVPADPAKPFWSFRRYRHTDNTFLDPTPRALPGTVQVRDLHAAAAGGKIWVAYADGAALQALRLDPVTAAVDMPSNTPATGQVDVFVLAIDDSSALAVYDTATGLVTMAVPVAAGAAGAGQPVPGSDADNTPAAVRDADGTVYLVSAQPVAAPPGGPAVRRSVIVLRRRDAATGRWGPPQPLTPNTHNDVRPHPVLVPGSGVWVLWTSDRLGDPDVVARQVVTAI